MKSLVISLRNALDRFLFESTDPRVASFLRIGYALILTINVIVWMIDAELWFTDDGLLTSTTAQKLGSGVCWSLFYWIPATTEVITICLVVLLLQSILLLLGVWSRFQAISIFVWLVSFQHRNLLICDGEDTVMRLFAFFMIFLPLDHCYSLTRYLQSRWTKSTISWSDLPEQAWGLRLFQIEMTLIYASTAWCKLQGSNWQNGTALFYVSRMADVYGRPWMPNIILDTPWLSMGMTWGVLLIESLLPICLWIPRTRKFAIIAGVCLHLGIECSMNLFLFQWIMILGLLTFVKPNDWKLNQPLHARRALARPRSI